MICITVGTVKTRGIDGVIRVLSPGKTFEPTNPEQVKPLIEKGLVRVVQELSAIMIAARDEVIEGGRWKASQATRTAENDMEAAQQRGAVIDFFEAAQRWKATGTG